MIEIQNNDITELMVYRDENGPRLCDPTGQIFITFRQLSDVLQDFSSLQKISLYDLYGIGLPDRMLKNIFDALKNHKNLQVLNIKEVGLGNDSFQALCDLIKEARLRELIVSPSDFSVQQMDGLNNMVAMMRELEIVPKQVRTALFCWGAYIKDKRTFPKDLDGSVLEILGEVTLADHGIIKQFKLPAKFRLVFG